MLRGSLWTCWRKCSQYAPLKRQNLSLGTSGVIGVHNSSDSQAVPSMPLCRRPQVLVHLQHGLVRRSHPWSADGQGTTSGHPFPPWRFSMESCSLVAPTPAWIYPRPTWSAFPAATTHIAGDRVAIAAFVSLLPLAPKLSLWPCCKIRASALSIPRSCQECRNIQVMAFTDHKNSLLHVPEIVPLR